MINETIKIYVFFEKNANSIPGIINTKDPALKYNYFTRNNFFL